MKKKSALRKPFLMVCALAFVLLVILFFFGSCRTQTMIKQTVVPLKDTLTIWEQRLRKNIDVKDSVRFYNSTEIKVARSFFDEFNFVENGVIFSTDSIVDVLRTIPIKTPGLMVQMDKDRTGVINIETVSFSKKEITYTLNFYRKGSVKVQKDGSVTNPYSFILGGKATIFFRGHKYKDIPITTVGKDDCVLLVNYRKKTVHLKDENSAEGQ